jgi:outer membrane protein assembly factor BamD
MECDGSVDQKKNKMKKLYLYFFSSFLLFLAMNIKSIKNDDVAVKFEIGTKLYEAGKYKSNKTFEQIAPAYRGKPQAEKLFTCFHRLITRRNNII